MGGGYDIKEQYKILLINQINPIPAGVLENQDMLGGPPSKSHVLCPNMTNDTSLESSCALLLESAKKFAKILSNHSLGCLERWKFPCMIIEGLQYGFVEL